MIGIEIQLKDDVQASFKKRADKLKDEWEYAVFVGYAMPYALPVHENMHAKHPNGMAKFLEIPARAMRQVMGGLVASYLAKGARVRDALLAAGRMLQQASQMLVPIDTRALHDSAYHVVGLKSDQYGISPEQIVKTHEKALVRGQKRRALVLARRKIAKAKAAKAKKPYHKIRTRVKKRNLWSKGHPGLQFGGKYSGVGDSPLRH